MSQTRYFRLSENVQSGYWYLGDPRNGQGHEVDDPSLFRAGRPVQVESRLSVPIIEPGKPLDFSTAGTGAAPIVHVTVASIFAELAPNDVQLLPVDIKGHPDQYLLLVATKLIRCIDDTASEEVRYWKPEHGQPERVGDYKVVSGLRIDPSKVGDAKVFRTWGWDLALIVAEDVKDGLERAKTTGMKFKQV
ncbi:imm11 family protein [Myxococcus stipitatus]|uniref:imm11 family protein n=1 Tax=Myxococcus stipitatus TaxID=83455 RepID=UPI0030D14BE1